MFTGIVEEKGRVAAVERQGDAARVRIACSTVLSDVAHGDSIAVSGVCLSVTDHDDEGFWADCMKVTLDYTTLGDVTVGRVVNLERAVRADGRLGGHIVQGHVDGTATVVSRTPGEEWEVVRLRLDDPTLTRHLAKKGSVTLDGTSLTVSELGGRAGDGDGGWFEVSLIPTTLELTSLGGLQPGDRVNVECDVLSKYVERLLEAGPATGAP